MKYYEYAKDIELTLEKPNCTVIFNNDKDQEVGKLELEDG